MRIGRHAGTASSSTEPPATTELTSSSTNVGSVASGCGVTLADVQALLPPNSGLSQNRTPDPIRCNFTWNDNGRRGIDVARVRGGRATFEAQTGKVPNGPTTLKDGTPYETLTGLGERAWAFGNSRQANVVVVRGADLYAVDLVIDGTPPAGGKSATGIDTRSLEICQALARRRWGELRIGSHCNRARCRTFITTSSAGTRRAQSAFTTTSSDTWRWHI